ncbi:MAG: tripartite tricarboxylate transporter TctB family protein [Trueperaceae bacterium]|nr:tripartite tricarboxylate transporter TctB family protein [Trueperaceae bacterium]
MSDRIAGGVTIAIAVAFMALAFTFRAGRFSDPLGARFVPIAIGVLVIAACVALLVKPRTTTTWPEAPTWARLALCLVAFVAYGYMLVPLGFIVATTLAFALFALLFRGPPLRSVVAAVLFSVAAYALFSMALDLYLPTGRLFEGWF